MKSKNAFVKKEGEGDDKAKGPLKRPIKDNHLNAEKRIFGYNKPLVLLDYEHHEQGIINKPDLEMDDVCNIKQGFAGLITGETPFNSTGKL